MLLLGFGIYLASDGGYWEEPFVAFGVGAIAIIALVGGGVIVPATKRLAGLEPASDEYATRLPPLHDGRDRARRARPARHLRDGGQAVLING